MFRAASLCLLAACNQIYGLEPTRVSTNDARICARGAELSPGVEVAVPAEYNIEAARFTPTRAIAYLSLCPSGSPGIVECEIYTSPYSAVDERFGGFSKMTGVSAPMTYDSYPTIAADGQHLLFASSRDSMITYPHIFVAETRAGSFDDPTITQLLPDVANEPFIVGGGRVLYFSIENKLYRMEGDPPMFGGAPVLVAGVDTSMLKEAAPVPSEDERELFFAGGDGIAGLDIYLATREAPSDPFGTPVKLDTISTSGVDYPVSLSPDGCALYYINKTNGVAKLFVAKR